MGGSLFVVSKLGFTLGAKKLSCTRVKRRLLFQEYVTGCSVTSAVGVNRRSFLALIQGDGGVEK